MSKKDPFQKLWGFISIPLSALGLLSLSDQLLSFNDNIQKLINGYQELVYPIYIFLLSWVGYEIPTWMYDYLTLGLLFASSHKRAFGFLHASSKVAVFVKNVVSFILSIIFWPYLLFLIFHRIRIYDKDGIVRHDPNDPDKFVYKYNYRDEEVLVLKYIMAAIMLAIIVVIVNYTYF
jgi:hypothetical protein